MNPPDLLPRSKLETPHLILAYAAAFAAFILIPILLSDVDAFKGLSIGDLVDAPLILLPSALLVLMAQDSGLWSKTAPRLAVAVALVVLIQGHAVHLAANAIAHSLDESDPAWEPAYFLDEHWGHYELHTALLVLALLFIATATQPQSSRYNFSAPLLISVAIYGSLLASSAIEGQTVPLTLPASALLALILPRLIRHRPDPFAIFFGASYALCLLALIVYGALNTGWPQIL